MPTTKQHSNRRSEILSGDSHKAYLADCEARAKQALQPIGRPVAILLPRYGISGLYWCKVHTVKLDIPDKGFMIAIPLADKPKPE
jgi:hypothetical protein